jgi:hypothetical protein
MTTFQDVSQLPAAEADALFASILVKGPLRLWAPGEPVDTQGARFLIGVATWSAQDMQWLDALSGWAALHPTVVRMDVFNVAECQSPLEFARYIPGITDVFHTPVVGLWFGDHLVQTASGKAGRDLVARVCETGAEGLPART